MANAILSFPEFPNDAPLLENTSYVISSNHPIKSVNATIPPNVTLYFMGGVLTVGTAGIELKGNQTRIVAPIEQIFASSLNVGGTWCLDRAYPQWFGAVAYLRNFATASVDSADAINKAITMKQTGEVFIPRGSYKVGKTILVKYGINLLGEFGARIDPEASNPDPKDGGTVLHPTGTLANYYGGYFMMINIKNPSNNTTQGNAQWERSYPSPGTSIKNIFFANITSKVSGLKGILVAGSFQLDYLYWLFFRQAVACVLTSGYSYADSKKVTNCSYDYPENLEGLYAFDLRGLGDALVFQQNGIHSAPDDKKGLQFSNCNGGNITSNIINADVYLDGCKGIVFESNHMEGGAQVLIQDTNVTLLNNYFWKHERPSLRIRTSGNVDTPVVNLTNNLFLFYENEGESFIKNVCEYDILIDRNVHALEYAIIHIVQTYRYWVRRDLIYKMYPYGIKICRMDGTKIGSLENFNNFSYSLSTFCSIMSTAYVIKSFSIDNPKLVTLSNNGTGGSTWLEETGIYTYSCQTVWDFTRKIVGSVRSIGVLELTKNGSGGRFFVENGATVGLQALIRIYRRKTGGESQFVEVPICGTAYLYDNGISICGYKWETTSENMISGTTNIESFAYKGKNIECKAPSAPVGGVWEKGDIVFNTGTGTTSFWMYNGTQWIAR